MDKKLKNPKEDEDFSNNFGIDSSDKMGRFMVAKKNFLPGEIILSESPLVVGPCSDPQLQCIACYVLLGPKFELCQGCAWPVCSKTCRGLNQRFGHTQSECSVLSKCAFDSPGDQSKHNLTVLTPLRCLLLKKSHPDTYCQLLEMESHDQIRKTLPKLWSANQKNIVDKIVKEWGLKQFTEDEVHTICGILEVNAFEIGHENPIRGLYPKAFLMSHNCVPNTNHCDDLNDFKLTIRASTRITFGSPITLSYAYTLQATKNRQRHLKDNKFFKCTCDRCSDPTELKTYTSALICPKCSGGLVLSEEPLNEDSSWSCKSKECSGFKIAPQSHDLLLKRISQEIDLIHCNDITSMELILDKYRNVLHPNHYLFLGVKVCLSQLYGKISGFLINELTEKQLLRKIDLCKSILKVFDQIEPGYTRIRGVTLYELHAPLMILLTRSLSKESSNREELRKQLFEVVNILGEAKEILLGEPEMTAEGQMGLAAQQALEQIGDWNKVLS